ncbi:MAG: IPT/TIG domain-containing protein [Deltaproteobacteria bacterium]|nr:IPT/TIG domain-containing protein [Deltaproteobacteria bacterium]
MRFAILAPMVALALVGCTTEPLEDYYANRVDPSIAGLSVQSEEGNIGGKTTEIQGSGFGDSASGVVVLLGHHNAEVVDVTDTAITIVTPPGPITGGPVSLLVATPTGYAQLDDAYTYDRTVLTGGSDPFDGQTAYILAQNLWASCYGGLWDNPDVSDCGTFAWFGEAGITGDAEFFNFSYPRVQAPVMGFVTGNDMSPNQWHFSDDYVSAFPSGIDDLRYRVGDFKLRNPDYEGSSIEVDLACATRATDPAACADDDVKAYDKGVLNFCEGQDRETGGTYSYTADWPVRADFFANKNNGADPFTPVDIVLEAPGAGIAAEELVLPGAIQITGTDGFDEPSIWALSPLNACLDQDDDGQAFLDEEGMVLAWEPVAGDVTLGNPQVEAHSYVMASVSMLHFGWFGGEGWKLRSSIMVPDDNNFDAATGLASVGIPNWVLYQFPTPNLNWSGTSPVTQSGFLGNWSSDAAYMFIEIYRVTDFNIPTEDGKRVVFSYVTGDMGIPSWTNPIAKGEDCADCVDGDGDGWVDALDPDCANDGAGEEIGFSDFTCNDGIDNNSDGLADAEDPLCAKGSDGETTCTDGVDNDADGWTDALDPDCYDTEGVFQTGYNEDSAAPLTACTDGVDNDGDGWLDSEDPGCVSGLSDDEGGYATDPLLVCNDGLDNDADGMIDAMDPFCFVNGPLATSETKAPTSQCADGVDNDGDGYMDSDDPDCDVGIREGNASWEGLDYPVIPTCYDGIDNDSDGNIDSADADCVNGFGDEDPL